MRNFSTYSEICINYATPSVKEATLRVCNVALSMWGTNEKASVSAYIVCQVESEQRFHPLNKERREFNWRGNLRQANRSILSDRWIMAKISKGCKSAAGNLCSLKPANVTPSKRHELRDGCLWSKLGGSLFTKNLGKKRKNTFENILYLLIEKTIWRIIIFISWIFTCAFCRNYTIIIDFTATALQ